MPMYGIVCTYTPTYKCMCVVCVCVCTNKIGTRFTTGLRSRIFGYKSNRLKASII